LGDKSEGNAIKSGGIAGCAEVRGFNGRGEGMLTTDEICFVIVAQPPQHVVTGTYYIGKDAVITKMSGQAARFRSYADAKQFATGNRIALNGSAYISVKNITDLEFHKQERFDNRGQITRNTS